MKLPLLGIAAALAGAAIGYVSVALIARQGFHAIVLPAALPGLFAGLVARNRSVRWAILYALIGVVAAVFTEWKYWPFVADGSFGYFVRHLGRLPPAVTIVIGVGAILSGVLSINLGRRRETENKTRHG